MQETPVAAIPTALLLSESSATTITCTIPAPIPTSKSTIPVHIYAASTPTGSTTTTSSLGFLHSLQGKPISGTTDRTIPYTPNITSNEECSKHLVTANIAGSPTTMTCPATRNAQAVTNAAWPIANARATFPNTENQPKSKTSYKEILIKNMCNNTHNAINALTKHHQLEPVLLLPTTASTITATASKSTAQTTTQKLSLPILPKAPRPKVASTKLLTSTRTPSGIHTQIITTMTLAAKQDSQTKIIQESSLSQQLAIVTTTDAVFTSKTITLSKSKPVESQLNTSPTTISAKKATSSKPNQKISPSTDRSSTKYKPTEHTNTDHKRSSTTSKKLLTLPSQTAVKADFFITKTKTKIKESTTISAADKQSHKPTRTQHFTHMHEIHAANTPSLTIPFTVFLLCMHAYLKTYKVTTLISFILTLQVLQNTLLLFQPLNSYTPSSSVLNKFDGHAHSITLKAFA
jgi:hypothetical protein